MADLFWLSDEQWAVVGRFMPTQRVGLDPREADVQVDCDATFDLAGDDGVWNERHEPFQEGVAQ